MPAGHVISYRLWCRGGLREREFFYSVIQCYRVLYSVNKVKRPRPQGERLKVKGGPARMRLETERYAQGYI
jgi:hypothetical protein